MRREYKSTEALGKWVKILLYAGIALGIVELFVSTVGITFFDQAMFSDAEPEGGELIYLLAYVLVYLFWVFLFITTAILYLIWFGRSYANIEALGGSNSYNVAWAYLSWFIPIVSLFFPYMMAKEMHAFSAESTDDDAFLAPPTVTPTSLTAWWVLWVVLSIAGNITFRMSMSESEESQRLAIYIDVFLIFIWMACAYLAAGVVTSITNRQTAHASRGSMDLPPDPSQFGVRHD